jgi:hypothetical protein
LFRGGLFHVHFQKHINFSIRINHHLKDKMENATPGAKFDYGKCKADLPLKRDQAATERQGISAASDDKGEDLKAGAEQIWQEIRVMLSNEKLKSKDRWQTVDSKARRPKTEQFFVDRDRFKVAAIVRRPLPARLELIFPATGR